MSLVGDGTRRVGRGLAGRAAAGAPIGATRPSLTIRETVALLAHSTHTIHCHVAAGRPAPYRVGGEKTIGIGREDVKALRQPVGTESQSPGAGGEAVKPRRRDLPADVSSALGELKAALAAIYGERLRGVSLYGACTRGDFDPASSDVDVMIVLTGEVRPEDEIGRYNDAVSDICLKYDVLISTVPVSTDWEQARWNPFLVQVRKEAVPV